MHISDVLKGEKKVELNCWVYKKREQKEMVFLVLRDSTGTIQAVAKGKIADKARELTTESSINVKGTAKKDKRAPGGYEIDITSVEPYQIAETYPIARDKSPEFLMSVRHLWLRDPYMAKLMRMRATIMNASREFLDSQEYTETHPPIITPNACEGGSTLFDIDYFGKIRYLSQSGQMYSESLIYGLEKVYVLSPAFRAEKSKTSRHINEFWMLEPEAAFVDMEGMMNLAEGLVSHVAKKLIEKHGHEIDPEVLEKIKKVKAPFKRYTYDEALNKLEKKGNKLPWGVDLSINEEKALSEDEDKPFFVYDYPTEIKAFYVKEHKDDPKKCYSFDLIGGQGYGELATGGERSEDAEIMAKRLKKDKVPVDNYQWYFDLRKYGSVPHSGFGIGIERMLQWFLKLDHIRDTIPYPRTLRWCYP